MEYELVSADEYDSLPEDNEECFVQFEAICRANMTAIMAKHPKDNGLAQEVRSQYMAMVSAVGGECGLEVGAPSGYDYDDFYNAFNGWERTIQGEIARLRTRARGRNLYSVQLLPSTRTKIEHYIGRLRDAIEKSDLEPRRREALGAKLDELVAELANRRLRFGKTLAILNTVLIGMAAATTIAADGPSAVTHIMHLIGTDKETEDAAKLRLAPPQRLLPSPPSWDAPRGGELDDEIPF